MSSLSIRDGGDRGGRPFPPKEVAKHVQDMEMGPWISSLVTTTLQAAEFTTDDFMGKTDDIVSIPELIQATAYHATIMGYSSTWEPGPSPTFDDFERRPCVYKAVMKKVESWSTMKGNKKLTAVRKKIRVRVSAKKTATCGRPDPLGVFGVDDDDVSVIYKDTDFKRIVCHLHLLGKSAEGDPRYYIHMIYRFYMNEFHKKLADDDKVLRFPSIQKVMDIKRPVGFRGSTPPEFRTFLRSVKGDIANVVTLPVPSKKDASTVVYGYQFESAVPWVPVMRAKIFDMFVELSPSNSPGLYKKIYPRYLVKGEGGCEEGNKMVVEALARSIEMSNLAQTLSGLNAACKETKVFLDNVLSIEPRVADISERYSSHPFREEGEQLRERLGFLLQESVRGVFRCIASTMPSFCNDIYASQSIPHKTMDVFNEYCRTDDSIKYQRREETVWRSFIIDVRKILCILHAWSRRGEVERFVAEHGPADGYMGRVLSDLG